MHPSLAPVAFIHDAEWSESKNAPKMSVANRRVAAQIAQQSSARAKRSGRKEPRTEESFAESNARFRRNGVKVAYAAYGWWRPRRYKVMWDAWKFARICRNRPLRVVATHGEATKPSASESRAFRLERVACALRGPEGRNIPRGRRPSCEAGASGVRPHGEAEPDWSGNKHFSLFPW